jgi:hypothetical protein
MCKSLFDKDNDAQAHPFGLAGTAQPTPSAVSLVWVLRNHLFSTVTIRK